MTEPTWLNQSLEYMSNESQLEAVKTVYALDLAGWHWVLIYTIIIILAYYYSKSDTIAAALALIMGVYLVTQENLSPVVQPAIVVILIMTLAIALWRFWIRK